MHPHLLRILAAGNYSRERITMAQKQQDAADSGDDTSEPRLADIVGAMQIPPIGGKMIREMIELT